MKKIVREHYPATNLPAELVKGLNRSHVRVTVEAEPARRNWTFQELIELRNSLPIASDDPVERIRSLRDEWDR